MEALCCKRGRNTNWRNDVRGNGRPDDRYHSCVIQRSRPESMVNALSRYAIAEGSVSYG